MRIALVKRRYSLKVGGAERYCVNLSRRLTAFGHDVTFIGESIDPELSREVSFVPVTINRLTSWTKNRSFAENTGRAAREGRFDVVYGLGRAFGLDAVRITDRLQSHWLNVYYRNPAYRTLQRLQSAAPHADRPRADDLSLVECAADRHAVAARSRSSSSTTTAFPKKKSARSITASTRRCFIRACGPTGCSSARNSASSQIGRCSSSPRWISTAKGCESLLRAFQISRIARVARLAVVGKGAIYRFRRMADALGVGKSVLFVGHRTDIHRFYGAADLSLMPTTYEPFPNVNLESLACGTPALTTETAGGADLIEDGKTGYLVSNVHAIGEIAERLDAHFSLSLGRAGPHVRLLLGDGAANDGRAERPADSRAVRRGAA